MDVQWAADAGGESWAQGLAMLADAGVKGLVILALAALTAATMRRGSAAARHLVWMLALGGLLLLPALGLLMPRWQLAVLPSTAEGAAAAVIEMDAPALAAAPRESAAAVPVSPDTQMFAESTSEESVSAGKSEIRSTNASKGERPLAFWLLVGWAAVALAIVAPLLAGLTAVARLQRRAPRFNGDRLELLARAMAEIIGLRRPVEVLCAGPGAMPMAAGLWRAVVFLPREAEGWPEEKLRAVLLHELAHVRRRDCLTQALAHLALALHWFDPLAWVAVRRLRIERERACDDLVLRAGERASDYAGHLLEIARAMHTRRVLSAAAITLAKQSQLEGRLLAVLDAGQKRGSLRQRGVAVGALAMIAIIVPLATAQLGAREANSSIELHLNELSDDGTVSLRAIDCVPVEGRQWALLLHVTNHTSETQHIGVDVYSRLNGFLGGSMQRAQIFTLEPNFEGELRQVFTLASKPFGSQSNNVRIQFAKLKGNQYYNQSGARFLPVDSEIVYETNLMLPTKRNEISDKEIKLRAKEQYFEGEPVRVEVQMPSLPYSIDVMQAVPAYIRINGRDYRSRTIPHFPSPSIQFWVDLGLQSSAIGLKEMPPGHYRVSFFFESFMARRIEDGAAQVDANVPLELFGRLESNEVEFEIVDDDKFYNGDSAVVAVHPQSTVDSVDRESEASGGDAVMGDNFQKTYARIRDQVEVLERESPAQSIRNLSFIGMYHWPYIGIGASSDLENMTIESMDKILINHILSNRRFAKVYVEIAAMTKSEATRVVTEELREAIKGHQREYAAMLAARERDDAEALGRASAVGVSGPDIANLNGYRWKMLSLMALAGHYRLKGCADTIDETLNYLMKSSEVTQIGQLFPNPSWRMSGTLLSPSIIATALLGTHHTGDSPQAWKEQFGVNVIDKKFVDWKAKVTYYDRPAGYRAPDTSRGEYVLQVVTPLDEQQLSTILQHTTPDLDLMTIVPSRGDVE